MEMESAVPGVVDSLLSLVLLFCLLRLPGMSPSQMTKQKNVYRKILQRIIYSEAAEHCGRNTCTIVMGMLKEAGARGSSKGKMRITSDLNHNH